MMAVKRKTPESNSSDNNESDKPKRAKTASPQQKKYTVDDALLIRKLKEEDGLSWDKISEYFPGCSSKILQVQWSRRLKGLCDTFTAKEMEQMKTVIVEQKKKFWANVGVIMGKSGPGCQRAAKEAKLSIELLY